MRDFLRVVLVVVCVVMGRVSWAEEVKTGAFEATFSERSPLSDVKVLPRRLGYEGKATDYELGKQTFLVYVPEKYEAGKPMGLLVFVNFGPAEGFPKEV